ncbi:2-dehydro-3-deoxygalactonokinase [Roseibium sp. TrichSKD4]|uniref:2-dehydro-3-deoxygalactonokinase n=1 Tax=Roseibium sp. TrichSKD4 TaxID=744980 RepID=UPI0001E563EA|nr:2-dehydro-3-deoxygalactonokinase [Roseibium sp. TrichSKD4]EFO34117.1 2-dehydro-3-deoxygalactonokinase [Roseibium sp. TrichSKD4]
MNNKVDWVAVDWGTSSLRAWLLDADNTVLDHKTSDKGMGQLAQADFEAALLDLIGAHLPEEISTPVIICGMAGARQGWAEAPYLETPCPPPGISNSTKVRTNDSRLEAYILPGVKQLSPPDVMRGEETQIAGFLAEEPQFSGMLCLPGTHTKWASLQDGTITAFRTFMTGELFALLSNQSVLRYSVESNDGSPEAFSEAVREASAHPIELTAGLFGIRAAGLVAGQTASEARGRLSGLLIGSEVAAVLTQGLTGEVAILGADKIATAYRDALQVLGRESRLIDASTTTLRGLQIARKQLQERT